jgi:hemolysin III
MRPRWRGRFHAAALVAAIPAGVALVISASSPAATVTAAVYVTALVAVYATSACYHILARTPRAQKVWRRLDHSMIYVLIAGTYTPVCFLALPPSWRVPTLVLVWAGAVAGVVLKATERASRTASAMYLVLGWLALAVMPAMISHRGAAPVVWMAVGGLIYTAGAVLFFTQRPRLSTQVFGFHEVWHLCTIAAGAVHFAAVWQLV